MASNNIAKPSLILSASTEQLDKNLKHGERSVDDFFRRTDKKMSAHNQAHGKEGFFGHLGKETGFSKVAGMGAAGLAAGFAAEAIALTFEAIKGAVEGVIESVKELAEYYDTASKEAESLGAS